MKLWGGSENEDRQKFILICTIIIGKKAEEKPYHLEIFLLLVGVQHRKRSTSGNSRINKESTTGKTLYFDWLIAAFTMHIWRNHGCTETLIYAVKHMKGHNKEYDEKNAAIWQRLQKP